MYEVSSVKVSGVIYDKILPHGSGEWIRRDRVNKDTYVLIHPAGEPYYMVQVGEYEEVEFIGPAPDSIIELNN